MFEYQKQLLDLVLKEGTKRIVICGGRQLGKTYMGKKMMMTFFDELVKEKPTYIKKFYLRSGTFEFRLFGVSKKWCLTKVSKPNRWEASNIKYIFKFLSRRGAKQEDILEIEKKVLEVIS